MERWPLWGRSRGPRPGVWAASYSLRCRAGPAGPEGLSAVCYHTPGRLLSPRASRGFFVSPQPHLCRVDTMVCVQEAPAGCRAPQTSTLWGSGPEEGTVPSRGRLVLFRVPRGTCQRTLQQQRSWGECPAIPGNWAWVEPSAAAPRPPPPRVLAPRTRGGSGCQRCAEGGATPCHCPAPRGRSSVATIPAALVLSATASPRGGG